MNRKDKAYIISLKHQTKRLIKTHKILASLGFKNIEPFEARTATPKDLKEFLKGKVHPSWVPGRTMWFEGALGCLWSHKAILEKVVESRQPAFIFEDDIIQHKEFEGLYRNVEKRLKFDNWIFLGSSQLKWKQVRRTSPFYTAKLSMGGFAYWVAPIVASAMLENIETWPVGRDQYIGRYLAPRLKPKVCFPYLFIADIRTSSTTPPNEKTNYTPGGFGWNLEDYVLPY